MNNIEELIARWNSDGKPFLFLPMFGFASPDEIPARPADYGVLA